MISPRIAASCRAEEEHAPGMASGRNGMPWRAVNRPLTVGGALCLLVVLFALFGPYLAASDPEQQALSERLQEPVFTGGSWDRPLGTDQLGRDVLARLAEGTRLSLIIGLTVTAIAGSIGVALGLVAGVLGNRVDRLLTFLVDVQIAVPVVVLAVAAAALLTPGISVMIGVLSFSGWAAYQRVVRAQTRLLRHSGFVEASWSSGASRGWVARKHIAPNTAGPVIVIATQQIAAVVLFESALSYLGLGLPPGRITLGGMVSDGREAMLAAWWVPALPGAVIALIVLGLNLMGDGLRQQSDRRLQGGT